MSLTHTQAGETQLHNCTKSKCTLQTLLLVRNTSQHFSGYSLKGRRFWKRACMLSNHIHCITPPPPPPTNIDGIEYLVSTSVQHEKDIKMLSTAAWVPDVKMSKQQPFNFSFLFSLVGSSVGSGPVRGLGHSTQGLHAGT